MDNLHFSRTTGGSSLGVTQAGPLPTPGASLCRCHRRARTPSRRPHSTMFIRSSRPERLHQTTLAFPVLLGDLVVVGCVPL
ncbi:hypothetical protein L226DRAFT_262089 [Lentinus tigrinus ALCF2SS1-7]|uniref:Uncharacterized protein n=1 Tax=Lentinus tigrinus ALCF2SS1-6 TaxID=1328759 RepID=A0A5C2RUF8_9APHY|nr:hypothetical protein L227DRAFT_339914 [Lentinus tigrinus ALCF2SS1-6]RPD69893.1 hypothetical protein L226DRAFT_262089 [Lentinus tigrinus ALCF2SS1-7]